MKGTQPFKILTRLAQGKVSPDDFKDVGTFPNPLDDIFRDQPFIHECPACASRVHNETNILTITRRLCQSSFRV